MGGQHDLAAEILELYGGWSDLDILRKSPKMDMPFTVMIPIGMGVGVPWLDLWDPKLIAQMDKIARDAILPVRDNVLPDADSPRLTIRTGGAKSIQMGLLDGKEPVVDGASGITVRHFGPSDNVRNSTIVALPVSLFGKNALSAGIISNWT